MDEVVGYLLDSPGSDDKSFRQFKYGAEFDNMSLFVSGDKPRQICLYRNKKELEFKTEEKI